MFALRSLWEGTLILFFVLQSVGNICVLYHDLPSTCPVPVWLSLMPSRSCDVSEKNGPDRHDPKTIDPRHAARYGKALATGRC